jgi:hypothetical protein
MKWVCLLCLVLIGCNETKDAESSRLTKWGRNLIDCPTASITVTSSNSVNDIVRTLFITGCGLKVCCSNVSGYFSCFPCKKDQWY